MLLSLRLECRFTRGLPRRGGGIALALLHEEFALQHDCLAERARRERLVRIGELHRQHVAVAASQIPEHELAFVRRQLIELRLDRRQVVDVERQRRRMRAARAGSEAGEDRRQGERPEFDGDVHDAVPSKAWIVARMQRGEIREHVASAPRIPLRCIRAT